MKKLLLLCLFLLTAGPCLAEMLSVAHQPAELKNKPKVARAEVLGSLPLHAPLKVLETGSEYIKVQDYSGRVGYIHKAVISPEKSLAIKADVCNVRSGPGTDFAIVFKATRGSSYRVLGQKDEWIEIASDTGQTGWVWQNLTWGY